MHRGLRNVLHRRDPLHWHCDLAAAFCLASFVYPSVYPPIRPGLRCVGELHAARIFADLVIGDTHATTTDSVIESARITFVSGRVKAGSQRLDESFTMKLESLV